jgi:hypothetical protein
MPKTLDRLVKAVWTGWWVAHCPTCGKELRHKKVRKGQVRYCSDCGKERGLLHYEKEMEEEVIPLPASFAHSFDWEENALLGLFESAMPAGHTIN